MEDQVKLTYKKPVAKQEHMFPASNNQINTQTLKVMSEYFRYLNPEGQNLFRIAVDRKRNQLEFQVEKLKGQIQDLEEMLKATK